MKAVLDKVSTTDMGVGALESSEEDIVTIALKMKESTGNDYMNMSIGFKFAIQLIATQYTVESDSFDSDYDAKAEFPSGTVETDKGTT